MGVDISVLVQGRPVSLPDLAGKSIAIDAFNTLYQFLTTIRQPDGTPLMDRDGRVTSHLSGLFYRSASLLEMGIRPVYVFDGEPPKLKQKTLEERRTIKAEAEVRYREALAAGDMKRALTMASRTSRLTNEMIEDSKALLDSMGIPWIDAPSEGEAQIGHMVRKGDVWAGASQDYDALLFGTPILVRNLTLAGRRRIAGGRTVEVTPEVVVLRDVLSDLSVTREQLVDMGILVGTDFNEGIKGIGPKKALALVRRLGGIEGVMSEGKIGVPEEYQEVRELFLSPKVTDAYSLKWRLPNEEQVRRIMCDRHSFGVDRIDSVLHRLTFKRDVSAQRRLDSW